MSEELRQKAIGFAETAVNNLMRQTPPKETEHPTETLRRQQQLESLAMWHLILAALRAYNG